eukprot:4072441-Alexandrium_andersonii.AAC.1
MSDEEVLRRFGVAPLVVRRDIALLGMIHRTILEKSPLQFAAFFRLGTQPAPLRGRRHLRHLRDPCGVRCPDNALRSALIATRVYNILSDFVVAAPSVKAFQSCFVPTCSWQLR